MSRSSSRKVQKKANPVANSSPPARDKVITFRISAQEAAVIQRAADREPVARYSRRAVLACAEAEAKGKK